MHERRARERHGLGERYLDLDPHRVPAGTAVLRNRWADPRARVRHLAVEAGVRRRFAPHQLRHAHAVELLHEGIPLPLIQRQLRHAHLSTTGTYLEGISSEETIGAINGRKAPMMHASAGLEL
jgi:integrase